MVRQPSVFRFHAPDGMWFADLPEKARTWMTTTCDGMPPRSIRIIHADDSSVTSPSVPHVLMRGVVVERTPLRTLVSCGGLFVSTKGGSCTACVGDGVCVHIT